MDWVGCVSGWNGVEFRNTRGLHFGLMGKEGLNLKNFFQYVNLVESVTHGNLHLGQPRE